MKKMTHLGWIAAFSLLLLASGKLVVGADEKPASPDKTQTEEKKAKKQDGRQRKNKKNAAKRTAETADARSAELGVMVAASPGPGVLVMGVRANGPADKAGIEAGDYILAVGENVLGSPAELQKIIAGKKPGEKVKLQTWRRGQEQMVTAKLRAAKRTAFYRRPAGGENLDEHPWVGVFMRDSNEGGVWVSRVYLNSPASKAGLEPGDRIVRIAGEKVSDPEDVADHVKSLEPGDEVELVIERDGERQTLTISVGSLADFHARLFGEGFRRFDGFHELLDPDFDGIPELKRFRMYFRSPDDDASEE